MTCVGQESREIYETFNFDNPGDEMRLASVLQKFSKYCNTRKNITILCLVMFCLHVLHIDITKGKTFMTLSQNWKNLVQNENLVNISQIKNEPSNWNITLSSNGTPMSYKIDTGAQCNVIFVESLENVSPKPDLQPVNVKLFTYNGSKIPLVGKCSLTLHHKSNYFKV